MSKNKTLLTDKETKTVTKVVTYTINGDKILENSAHSKMHPRLGECEDYIKDKKNVYAFGEDKNADMKKRFYAMEHKTAYLLSRKKIFNLYEYWVFLFQFFKIHKN